MKRLAVFALILLLGLCCLAAAQAVDYWAMEQYTWEKFEYCLLTKGMAGITRYNGYEEDLVIPEEVDGVPVKALFSLSSGWRSTIKTVTIPDSVTLIQDNPFLSCESLEEIRISPDNPLFEVKDGVLFSREDHRLICCPCCLSITEYTVPQGTEIIGNCAFRRCEGLTSVSLPDGLKKIGDGAFERCSGLKTLDIPDSVTEIGFCPFEGCKVISHISVIFVQYICIGVLVMDDDTYSYWHFLG